jgi:hypothetical protein
MAIGQLLSQFLDLLNFFRQLLSKTLFERLRHVMFSFRVSLSAAEQAVPVSLK